MTTSPGDIVAIIEYGATARDDADEYSDRDICVFSEDVEECAIEEIRLVVSQRFSTEAKSVSCYRLSTVDAMVCGGSLFLWHLRLEGKVLFDPDGIAAEALGALPPYTHFRRDVERFRGVFDDVAEEYVSTGTLSVFELHVLSVVTRNLCMLLTVRAGRPAFGRRSVYLAARTLYPQLPLSDQVWNALMTGHLRFMRDIDVRGHDEQSRPRPDELLNVVRQLIDFATRTLS